MQQRDNSRTNRRRKGIRLTPQKAKKAMKAMKAMKARKTVKPRKTLKPAKP